jgi:hypothetical protein
MVGKCGWIYTGSSRVMLTTEQINSIHRLHWSRAPSAAPLRGYPTDSSVRDIVTERRLG